MDTPQKYRSLLNDNKWIVRVAYLADIFGLLNVLNVQLQGKGTNVFSFLNKIEKKIDMWMKNVKNLDFAIFPSVTEIVAKDQSLSRYISKIIFAHLKAMLKSFKEYFPPDLDLRRSKLWIINPFLNVNERNDLTQNEIAQLLSNFVFGIWSFICVYEYLI